MKRKIVIQKQLSKLRRSWPPEPVPQWARDFQDFIANLSPRELRGIQRQLEEFVKIVQELRWIRLQEPVEFESISSSLPEDD